MRLQTDPISGDPVLLTQETVVLLNRTGHAILSRCDGSKTLSQIIAELEALYSNLSPDLLQEVSAYLERLTEKGWVEWL